MLYKAIISSSLRSLSSLRSSSLISSSLSSLSSLSSSLSSSNRNIIKCYSSLKDGGGERGILSQRVRDALITAYGNDGILVEPMVLPGKSEFGDYQCNAALPLSKILKLKPRDIAEKLMSTLQVDDIVERMDISGPGFINIHMSSNYIKNKLLKMVKDDTRLGISIVENPQRVVVDFSSPNIAKEMHVGHLRSTIIGDTLSKILEFLGNDVIRLNHVGDWGTQFGMLIHYLRLNYPNTIPTDDSKTKTEATRLGVEIGDLVDFYKKAKKQFDEDLEFQEAARNEVVKLQAGDAESLRAWKLICELSRDEFQKIYDLLGVTVEERGESFYNPLLASLVAELEEKKFATESQGALCIFLPGYVNPDGTPQPLIVRKSDGGFLYATTDLAAVKHRTQIEKANRVLYVTDVGQAQHFQMVFDAAKTVGLVDDKTELVHVPFGLVQGEDGKKFKTRSGDTVKLKDLLNEAIKIAGEDALARAKAADSNHPDEMTEEDHKIAKAVGIGAVKYADLAMNRESNYRFSYKKMLSLSGNTAPYMLYAYVRIQGIRRRAAAEISSDKDSMSTKDINTLVLEKPEEIVLAKHILKLEEILIEVSRDLYPSKMCEYLFELSQKFNQFYENCPVLKAETKEIQQSRAVLCSLTADVLQLSLGLLGIKTVEKL